MLVARPDVKKGRCLLPSLPFLQRWIVHGTKPLNLHNSGSGVSLLGDSETLSGVLGACKLLIVNVLQKVLSPYKLASNMLIFAM